MSSWGVKFMQFNDIIHWIFSPWELVHEAEITYGATFSLVDSKLDIIEVYIYIYICASQGCRKGFS